MVTRAEVDRLPARTILRGEFWIGEVRVRRTRRHDGEVALAEQRRHRLATAAGHRADGANHGRLDDHLAGVDGGLRRIVLASGCGAVVQNEGSDLVATDTTGGVGLLDRQQRAAQDGGRILGAGAGERKIDADGHEFGLGARGARDADQGSRTEQGDCRTTGNPTASLNLHDGLLPHLSAARTPRQSVRQSPREADAQGCD